MFSSRVEGKLYEGRQVLAKDEAFSESAFGFSPEATGAKAQPYGPRRGSEPGGLNLFLDMVSYQHAQMTTDSPRQHDPRPSSSTDTMNAFKTYRR